MAQAQPGILDPNPKHARYLTFAIHSVDALPNCLRELQQIADGRRIVIGFGLSLLQALNKSIDGLKTFPASTAPGLKIPATPAALWCWLRGTDPGELFHQSRLVEALLAPAFYLQDCTESFQYDANRDLSGYEDGTENPTGDDAVETAILQNGVPGLDGCSFVAVQQWLHDFEAFDAMTTEQLDDCIGRHVADNEEFDEAPESAHVKRSAQESFSPEAFMLRRSMPWASGSQAGLMFVAFGHSFDAFEAILHRMTGGEDGIQDGLFGFTHPISGSYYWCPPMKGPTLDLSAIGL